MLVQVKKRRWPQNGAKAINWNGTKDKRFTSGIFVNIGELSNISVCVDTGASLSCISSALVSKMQKVKWVHDKSRKTLFSASGNILEVKGIVEVPMVIDQVKFNIRLFVVSKLYPSVLIGLEFLCQHEAIINLRTGMLTLHKHNLQAETRFVSRWEMKNQNNILSSIYERRDNKNSELCKTKRVRFESRNERLFFSKYSIISSKALIIPENKSNGILKNTNCKKVSTETTTTSSTTGHPVSQQNQTGSDTSSNSSIHQCHCVNKVNVSRPDEYALRAKMESMINVADTAKFEDTQALITILCKYKENFDCFVEQVGGNARVDPVKLILKDNIPVRKPPYRVSLKERQIYKEIMDEYLESGVAVKSKSNYSSPAILVRKNSSKKQIKRQDLTKDDIRLCVDYRQVNEHIQGSAWPLERTDDILAQLSKSNVYISVDLKSGYHQLKLSPESRNIVAFSTPIGLFTWTVVPFGISPAPNIFQMTMRDIFQDFSADDLLIFLDDFVVHAKTVDELLIKFERVMKRMEEVNLKMSIKKCQFLSKDLTLLGHRVSAEGVRTSPDKIHCVINYKPPKTVKQVRQFLGLTGYYRKFCKDYAKIAAPLTDLTKKDKDFTWTEVEQTAFERLKENLINTPTLRHFDEELPIVVEVDASGIGLGGILSHKEGKTLRPVAYASRKLSEVEQRYPNIEREFLACVYAIGQWRHYLYMKDFELRTDCKSLIYYKNLKDPSSRLIRFALKLQEYSGMKIVYQPGRINMAPDALSRAPVDPPEKGEDDEEIPVMSIQETNLPELQREDEDLSIIFRSLEHPHSVSIQEDRQSRRYTIKNNILHKKGNGDVPDLVMVPKVLINQIIDQYHKQMLGGGHLGVRKVVEAISNKYCWVNLENSVREYVKRCQHCQYRKGPNSKQKSGLLMPVKITENIFEKWAIDACGPFVKSNQGNTYILAATEYLSGYLITRAVNTIASDEVCKFLMEEMVSRFGVPRELISDNGKNFTSNTVNTFLKQIGCSKINVTPYHPQANGMIESNFKSLGNMLALYVSANQKDWDEHLPTLTFTLNTSAKETRGGRSPFYIVHGVNATLPIDVDMLPASEVEDEDVDSRVARLRIIRENTASYYNAGKGKQKEKYDKNRVKVKFEVGDLVMVYNPRNFKSLSRKLLCRWMGPYEIVEVYNDYLNYKIKDVRSGKTQNIHIARLKRYYPSTQ